MARVHGYAYGRLARVHQCHLLGWHWAYLFDHALAIKSIRSQTWRIHRIWLPCTRCRTLRREQPGWLHSFSIFRRLCICLFRQHSAATHQRNCVSHSPWYRERFIHVRVVCWRHDRGFHCKWNEHRCCSPDDLLTLRLTSVDIWHSQHGGQQSMARSNDPPGPPSRSISSRSYVGAGITPLVDLQRPN